ncbi:MAG: hypothetical protein PVG07_08895, partial [Acidobacteriota bacterium]
MTRRLSFSFHLALVVTLCASTFALPRPAPAADVTAERTGPDRLSLVLDPRLGASWQQAHVERLAVRSADRQMRITGRPDSPTLQLAAPSDRCSLVLADLRLDRPRTGPGGRAAGLVSGKIVACPDA